MNAYPKDKFFKKPNSLKLMFWDNLKLTFQKNVTNLEQEKD